MTDAAGNDAAVIEEKRFPILNEPWRAMTLPGLARGAAMLRPERTILSDSSNAANLLGRPASTLRAVDFDTEAALLARKLNALGLKPGERVLVLLPNTVEAGTGIIGVLAAGAVPAVTPIFTTEDALLAQAGAIGAAGILTITNFAGEALADRARNVAARCETIRFVAAFGERAPNGVAALDNWKTVEFFGDLQRLPPPSSTDDALITFDMVGGELRPFVRRHEQLIGEAARAAAMAQIGADSRMLVTVPPASLAGITFGLTVPLLTGATCNLVALFDGCNFAHALGNGDKLSVVLPGAAEEAFHRHCEGRKLRAETLIFIHRPMPEHTGTVPPAIHRGQAANRTLDCTALGEACCQIDRRNKQNAAPQTTREAVQDIFVTSGPPLKLRADARRLMASGPLAPSLLGADGGALHTGAFDTGFSPDVIAGEREKARATTRAVRSSAA